MSVESSHDDTMSFDNLLRLALSEWPETVDCRILLHGDLDLDTYVVQGLGNIERELDYAWIGKPSEVIMRSLHSSIAIVLHKAAKFMNLVTLNQIRPSVIKKEYDNYLVTSRNRTDLRWDEADYALVSKYFDCNKT